MGVAMSTKNDIYKKLTAEFPQEAYSADRTRSSITLTSLKAQYVVERLNEVLGVGNWALHGTWKEVSDGILYVGSLEYSITDGDKTSTHSTGDVPGFAGFDKANSGDAYKSARTDCLSKAASYLGIGNEMYKGNIKPPEVKEEETETEEESEEVSAGPRSRFKTTSRKTKAAEPEESEESEETEETEEEVAPKQASSLKPSRMFNRSKLTKKFGKAETEEAKS
jgi:hypothetical protein